MNNKIKGNSMTIEYKKLIDNFINSIIFSDEPENNDGIQGIIENPFYNKKGIDSLSLIYQRFYKYTDIPLALPVFGFYSIVSAWCVFSKATYAIPRSKKARELATWVMALAPSGSGKSLAMKNLLEMLPTDYETGKPVVEPNFRKADGPKAWIEQLADLPDGRGFWFQDEASQMFKLIEQQNSPLSEVREILLLIKDNEKVSRINSKENISADKTIMTQFFINTIDSMAKVISADSLKDGLLRRYQFAYGEKDIERPMTNFNLYELDKLNDDILGSELIDLFNQDINNNHYTFSIECDAMYDKTTTSVWKRQYKKFMSDDEGTFRTYMLESFKYAVFHHIINKKEGTVIDGYSMQYGIKVSIFLLNSLQKFIKYRAFEKAEKNIITQKNIFEKVIDYILQNENKKGFGIRAVQRKFNIKKQDLIDILKAIKLHNKDFKTKLFDKL